MGKKKFRKIYNVILERGIYSNNDVVDDDDNETIMMVIIITTTTFNTACQKK